MLVARGEDKIHGSFWAAQLTTLPLTCLYSPGARRYTCSFSCPETLCAEHHPPLWPCCRCYILKLRLHFGLGLQWNIVLEQPRRLSALSPANF